MEEYILHICLQMLPDHTTGNVKQKDSIAKLKSSFFEFRL